MKNLNCILILFTAFFLTAFSQKAQAQQRLYDDVIYLEDGTMVVIEGGANFVNQNINADVTSVLQTSAGRMVFGKYEGKSN